MPVFITKSLYLRTTVEPLGSFEVVLPLSKAMSEPQSWASQASSPVGGLCDLRLPPRPSYHSHARYALQQRLLSSHLSAYKEFVKSGGHPAACIEWLLDNS